MKLLNITNRFYIIIALALLLVSSIFFAFSLKEVFDSEYTEHLVFTRLQLEKQIAAQPLLQHHPFEVGDCIKVDTISEFTSLRVKITDTMYYDSYEEAIIPFRIMTYEQQIKDGSYRISIKQRMTESADYTRGVALTLLVIALDIIACFYFLNRYFSNSIWRPFYRALDKLKKFDLHKGSEVEFDTSRIDEFNALNRELKKLMEKVADDYQNLREFTENMSHETQTPLAIIRSKLELLMQAEQLSPEQLAQIHATLDAVNRLSKMNRGLILLTRIENEQFQEQQDVPISSVIKAQLELLEPFIQSRGIRVELETDDTVHINMNNYLADILITNLLSNAIKYNLENGRLRIELTGERLLVANTGRPMGFPEQHVFERFKKGEKKDSVGLGLSIVKKIADHYGFQTAYVFEQDMHCFTIRFNAS